MINLFKFQEDCVLYLLEKVAKSRNEEQIIIKSPTGSGKTLILQTFIRDYQTTFSQNTVFVWLCPGDGKLQNQSYDKFRLYYPNCRCGLLEDVLTIGFEASTTYFINWQKIIGKDRLALQEGERQNLYDKIQEAQLSNLEFILIIDEEHRNDTAKAQAVISAFKANCHIRASATATGKDVTYSIDELDVIDEGLITKALYINPDCQTDQLLTLSNESTFLLEKAVQQREKIKRSYEKIGSKINPLVLIQVPPKSDLLIESVEKDLADMGFEYDHAQVGKWTAEEKKCIDRVTEPDSSVCFLIFKQGIATGWDCPRAKILVKLRDNMSETFEIQTLGRIRRMPEQHHYADDILNYAYLYTFDERYTQEVLQSLDYAFNVKRLFLKEKCYDFNLETFKLNDKNRFAGEAETLEAVRQYFIKEYRLCDNKKGSLSTAKMAANFEENKKILQRHGFEFSNVIEKNAMTGSVVRTDSLQDPANLFKLRIRRAIDTRSNRLDELDAVQKIAKHLRLPFERGKMLLRRLFYANIGSDKTRILSLSRLDYMSFIIQNKDALRDISDAVCAKLYPDGHIEDLLNLGVNTEFKLPKEELYKFINKRDKASPVLENNAYKQYTADIIEYPLRSTPEILFERFCTDNPAVDWYYKNGDKGVQYFSIPYVTGAAVAALFYPDYIVKLNDGRVFIIETKGGEHNHSDQNIDLLAPAKFSALQEYCRLKKDLHFAFVRDKQISGEAYELYWSNTEYKDSLEHECWKNIGSIFA